MKEIFDKLAKECKFSVCDQDLALSPVVTNPLSAQF